MAERSICCNAKVKVHGKDTLYYECRKCHQQCAVFFVERKAWEINPRTRVVPSKKKKQKKYKMSDFREGNDV